MGRILITQSLLSSWNYFYNSYDEEKAYQDFINSLNKIKLPPTPQMQVGIDFENKVYAYCKGEYAPQENDVKAIGDIVKGGQFQVTATAQRRIMGIDFLLYAKLDVLKAGLIYDIKRSNSYETGKYLDSPQHPFYLECISEAMGFCYLISDGNEVFTETYTRAEIAPINKTITDFINFLKAEKLFDLYLDLWRARE